MAFAELKNDLFLRALRGETVERPPVWMMRQAGRYLPEYMEIARKYDFFTRCETPELACEITVQPIDIVKTDAAILFSDILVIPQALGFEVQMIKGKGPVLPGHIQSEADAFAVLAEDIPAKLDYVMKAITLTRQTLEGRVPLIGFAGAPWTIFCYMVEGQGSKSFSLAKKFCYQYPDAARHLMKEITRATIEYLQAQVEAGAQALQVFDSWAGLLSPEDFNEWSLPYLLEISAAISDTPHILFAKGAWYGLERLAFKSQASALGLGWDVSPEYAREKVGDRVSLQGNFDPAKLHLPIPELKKQVHSMIRRFGKQRYIANLGHGMTPDIPVDHAKAFVEAVKESEFL